MCTRGCRPVTKVFYAGMQRKSPWLSSEFSKQHRHGRFLRQMLVPGSRCCQRVAAPFCPFFFQSARSSLPLLGPMGPMTAPRPKCIWQAAAGKRICRRCEGKMRGKMGNSRKFTFMEGEEYHMGAFPPFPLYASAPGSHTPQCTPLGPMTHTKKPRMACRLAHCLPLQSASRLSCPPSCCRPLRLLQAASTPVGAGQLRACGAAWRGTLGHRG
jgi:hypothetical protein